MVDGPYISQKKKKKKNQRLIGTTTLIEWNSGGIKV